MQAWKIAILLLSIYLTGLSSALAIDYPERHRDQYGTDFSYYMYPIAGDIPGLGTASGAGASVLNIYNTDTDFTGYFLEGDFEAKGLIFLDNQLIDKRLVFDVGYNDFLVSPVQYERGILSDPDNYILPTAQGKYLISQLTLTYDERRTEFYFRHINGNSQLLEVLDSSGNAFEAIDTSVNDVQINTVGMTLDYTDDRLDPRNGIRFEYARKMPSIENELQSEYYVNDYNLSGYIPVRKHDTIGLNLFYSSAHITRQAPTDFTTLQTLNGLNCTAIPPGPEQDQCIQTEANFINQQIAANRYGTATSLGGTQRLRSFDNGRFFAGNSLSYGVEYRWNLTDEYTPFNFYIAKGVRTGMQLAFFAEQGSVAEESSDLFENTKSSYGLGFRLILTGVVIRMDLADGDEGTTFQLFITYPWSMFSVDNPG